MPAVVDNIVIIQYMSPYNFIRFTRFFITQRFKVSRITDKTYLPTTKISGLHHPSAALYRYLTAQKRHKQVLSYAHCHPHIFTLKPAENNNGHPSCASTEIAIMNYLSVPPASTRHILFSSSMTAVHKLHVSLDSRVLAERFRCTSVNLINLRCCGRRGRLVHVFAAGAYLLGG